MNESLHILSNSIHIQHATMPSDLPERGISAYMDEGSYLDHKKKVAKRNENRALSLLSKIKLTGIDEEDEW